MKKGQMNYVGDPFADAGARIIHLTLFPYV
jgi:hypothetical protein